jgi:hypothetical protein
MAVKGRDEEAALTEPEQGTPCEGRAIPGSLLAGDQRSISGSVSAVRDITVIREALQKLARQLGEQCNGEWADLVANEGLAALARFGERLEAMEAALADCVQSIEDAYGGYAYVPEGSFEFEVAAKARALLAAGGEDK